VGWQSSVLERPHGFFQGENGILSTQIFHLAREDKRVDKLFSIIIDADVALRCDSVIEQNGETMAMKKPKQRVKSEETRAAKQEGSHMPNPSTVALLVVGTERGLHEDSPARRRALRYGEFLKRYDAIVYGKGESAKVSPLGENGSVTDVLVPNIFLSFYHAFQKGVAIISASPEEEWVVSAQDPFESGLIAYAIAKKTGVALHLQLHTDPGASAWIRSKKNRLRDLLFRFLAHRADALRVVSERAKRSALAHGADASRIVVIPVISDEESPRPSGIDIKGAYKEAGEIILSMGRLSYEKGFDVLLESMRVISTRRPSALLLLVGSGPEELALKKRVARLGLSSAVRFVPWVRDVDAYLKAADVVVMPSRFEGWGLVACEATRHGKVVVMTDTGCAGEVIVDGATGVVVPPEDRDALSDAVIRVLSDDAFRTTLGTEAQKRYPSLVTNTHAMKLHKESWETAYRHAKENKKQ